MNLNPVRIAAAIVLAACGSAHAVSFDVYAFANSSSGSGVGLPTVSLTAGQAFSVSVAATDLWSAGALPRWSNADGLITKLFATGSDDSGEPAGTQIGAVFPLWTEGNLTAAYGTLVGQIDNGDYFAIGTHYNGVASATGTLKLYYWDENNFDNSGFVTANINAIPEPSTYALMALGLAGVGFAARRRRD
jgi:hypothetical protein